MPSAEFIPASDVSAARAQIERDGHVGLSGLFEPGLAWRALAEARQQFIRWRNRGRGPGESAARLRINPSRQQALATIIEGMREGAVILGHSLEPEAGEVEQIDIIDMDRAAKGLPHRDKGHLTDVVAATNLQGPSRLWFEDGATYTIEPGLVVIHDLARDLLHQGLAMPDEPRIGLALGRHPR